MTDTSKINPGACDCCEWETENVKAYRNSSAGFGSSDPNADSHKWLCDLCAETLTGSFHEYPGQVPPGILTVLKTICYVGNAIIAEIKANKSK